MSDLLQNSRFLKAARREPTDTVPLWIMRQAGRYLPEYMAVRSKVTFMELCKSPELCAEVTLSAQRALGVDAAILFADLLPILQPMGLDLEYQKGEGPIIHNPVRSAADVDRVRAVEDVSVLSYVFETVKLVRRDLPADIPLIGFAGAPFTLASYVIEGGGSKNYLHTKRLMYGDPGAWRALLDRLADSVIRYLREQVAAGCQAVQLFDSWAGCLCPVDYTEYVLPHSQKIIAAMPPDVPVIHFVAGNPALLGLAAQAGGQVIGVDWRCDLDRAWRRIGFDRAVQGNLDPLTLLADRDTIGRRVKQLLDSVRGQPGHIFNLGHGVVPETDAEKVKDLVKLVHDLGAR